MSFQGVCLCLRKFSLFRACEAIPFVAPAVFSGTVRGAFGVEKRERAREACPGPSYRVVPVAGMIVRELRIRVWERGSSRGLR